MVSGKTAIIVVDIDDDLGVKAKIKGPIVGRKKNLNAAMALALADPTDSDSNAMFKAISLYDSMKKSNKEVEIITLTGHNRLGIKAYSKVVKQLENILKEHSITSCILVTDGSMDEEILPIIQSRLKVDGVEKVYVKQAKELEKTYLVILEKLREPSYRRILIGIPALFLLLISLVYLFDIQIQYLGIIIGTILLVKGFSLDEKIEELIDTFKVESSRTLALVLYVSLFIILLTSIYNSYYAYLDGNSKGLGGLTLYAYIFDSFITPLFIGVLLAMIIKIIDITSLGKNFLVLISQIHLVITALLAFIVIKVAIAWILNLNPPYVYFKDFLTITIAALFVEYVVSSYFKSLKIDLIARLNLKGKEVYDKEGTFYGKIAGVDVKNNKIKITSAFGKTNYIKITDVRDIGDSVVVE